MSKPNRDLLYASANQIRSAIDNLSVYSDSLPKEAEILKVVYNKEIAKLWQVYYLIDGGLSYPVEWKDSVDKPHSHEA